MSERRELNTQNVSELKKSMDYLTHDITGYSKKDIIAAQDAFRKAAQYRGFEVSCKVFKKDILTIIRK